MIPREVVRSIIEAGAQAPSGGNSQPWSFEVREGQILVRMFPEKDHPILNFRNRGTMLAEGALLENISIAAGHYGFTAKINISSGGSDRKDGISISFDKDGAKGDEELFRAIWKRATNRKPFKKEPLGENVIREITGIPAEINEGQISVKITEDPKDIKRLGIAASANEIVMFENRQLHKLFFDEIVWTEEEEKNKKSGLYLKTMELEPPQEIAVKAFRRWPIMRFANFLGAARFIAKGNAEIYRSTGAYGAVIFEEEDINFIRAGKVLERIWLRATALGLSFHLQTGINFLWQRVNGGGSGIFSSEHQNIIERSYGEMKSVFGVERGIIPAIFRIGWDGEPTARSSKKSPEIIFK